jgi:hypothetical protein
VKSPESNGVPDGAPGVKVPGATCWVTEWGIAASRFSTVTVEPAGTARSRGAKVMFVMTM